MANGNKNAIVNCNSPSAILINAKASIFSLLISAALYGTVRVLHNRQPNEN